MHCLLHWLLGQLLLNPHFFPVCLLENVWFPFLLHGQMRRTCLTWDLHKKQKDFLCPSPLWDNWVQCIPWSALTPKIIQSLSQGVTGKYKHNPGHTQWRNYCSLLSVYVCIYFLMAFSVLHPCSKGEHGLHSEDMESRKRNLLSEAPFYNIMPYITTTFSFPKSLIPPVSTCSLSLSQIIPHSFGGLAKLRAKLNCYLRLQLQS